MNQDLKKTLWATADKLRSSMDAAEYKHNFSELLQQNLPRYRNRAVVTVQVIEERIELTKKIQAAAQRGENVGLDHEKMTFYGGQLTKEAAARDLGDEELKTISVELMPGLRESVTVDCAKREAVRAKLRVMVKTLLRRYKYPPNRQEEPMETVLRRAESLSANWSLA